MILSVRRTLVALAAALALADGSIVVLALPDLAASLDATVSGAAAVIAVYTGVVALALPLAWSARRRLDPAGLGAGGLVLFAAGSLGCALAESMPTMLVMRGVQGAGGALAISTAAWMLRADAGGKTWGAIALAGAAAGPALGGALTQLFDWHAVFVVQIPLAVAAAVACVGPRWAVNGAIAPRRDRTAGLALGLLSAALAAALFLLVFELIDDWSVEPLAAGAALTVLPATGLASARVAGGATRTRAAAGALLVAGAIAALAAMHTASVWWAIAPLAPAGAGMGLALPALSGLAGGAAHALTIRHAAVTAALLLLADRIDTGLRSAFWIAAALALVAALLLAPRPRQVAQRAAQLVGQLLD
jgi:MFS family permease